MPSLSNPCLGWATVFYFLPPVFCAYRFLTARPPQNFPPGPKGVPFIGNVLQVTGNHLELLFKSWAEKYGGVVYANMINQPVVILSDLEATRDLFEKRGAIYSDRPRFVLISELMGWHSASTHARYGPRFRKHRRFIQQSFNQRAVIAFHPLQKQETLELLDGLMQTPGLFVQHLKRFAAATIFTITYGHKITSVDDIFVTLAEKAGRLTIESGSPAATLVDFFPVLRYIPTWLPFSGFKRRAIEARKAVDDMMNIPFNMVKNDMRSGKAVPSFTSTLLEAYCHPSKEAISADTMSMEDEEVIKGAAGTLYAAAEDTTVAVMETFILAMTRNPEVYRKAQEEIDSVIGTHRLPSFEDRGSLPYLECVLKEVLRWNPPAPLGLPHRVMEDDVYRGYHIPKGATVFANIFAILHNCAQPDSFLPERYLERDCSLPDPREVVFGFGRRICPGRYFAETSAWYMMVNITATLDISRSAEDLDNKDVILGLEVINGFIRHPKPFSCSIRPRSEKISKLIQEAKTSLELPL